MNQRSDSALLEAWRAGDRGAGDALLTRHFAPLRKFLVHRVGADADELLQRTLLACTQSCARIRGESSFRTYLYTIARHELYRYYRQRTARTRLVPFDERAMSVFAPSATEQLVHAESLAALRTALAKLREGDRTLLESFYVDELDGATLAGRIGIRPGSVRSRLARARDELAATLFSPARVPPLNQGARRGVG